MREKKPLSLPAPKQEYPSSLPAPKQEYFSKEKQMFGSHSLNTFNTEAAEQPEEGQENRHSFNSMRFDAPDTFFNRHQKIPLGKGSFATVYQVTYKNESYAVKWFNSENSDNFNSEITILTGLPRHCNIAAIQNWDELGDRWIAFEYAGESNLSSRLAKLAPSEIYNYGQQIAQGLQFLNSYKVIHLDIKSDNLVVSGQQLKIVDFGFATLLNDRGFPGHPFAPKGSPFYVAPEVINYNDKPSSLMNCDIFSFGRVIWEMANQHTIGPRDFRPAPRNNHEVLTMVRTYNPSPDANQNAATQHPLLVELSKKCCAKPENRPSLARLINFFKNGPTASQDQTNQANTSALILTK